MCFTFVVMEKNNRPYRPKDIAQQAKYIMELSTGQRTEKSAKVKPKTKKGHKYIVFDDLPGDQQDAWKAMGDDPMSSLILEEGKFTPSYHNYEALSELILVFCLSCLGRIVARYPQFRIFL